MARATVTFTTSKAPVVFELNGKNRNAVRAQITGLFHYMRSKQMGPDMLVKGVNPRIEFRT